MEKRELFETMRPGKALMIMALPTIASQLIILIYNLADTWYIGRTNNPYMVGASSLAVTVYLAATALANVFGVGGGSLMARLAGEKDTDEARRVASYSVAAAAVSAGVFSVLVLMTMNPLLRLLGAGENTLMYARQYLFATTVLGGIPTVMSMSMPQLLRNTGYSKEAGFGVGLGSLVNVVLDPLFMFVILPDGKEVLGAGIATMLSNMIAVTYYILMFRKLRDKTVLVLPRGIEKLSREQKKSLYSVGIPSAFSIFLFDIVTIVTNRLIVAYGDIPLAAMGIVLKLERIPLNIGLGICFGMVPLVAYNYGARNYRRMDQVFNIARMVILGFSLLCALVFWFNAKSCVGIFISDEATVQQGAAILRGRCFALPFMMVGYYIVSYMNAVNRGKISFILTTVRSLVMLIPVMLLMNHIWGLTGLIWSQLVTDGLGVVIPVAVYRKVSGDIKKETA